MFVTAFAAQTPTMELRLIRTFSIPVPLIGSAIWPISTRIMLTPLGITLGNTSPSMVDS